MTFYKLSVEMEGQFNYVCKFNQYGHCKFGPNCKHFHTKETCSKPDCNQDLCTARHPRPCVYFSRTNHCKFGDGCSYLHSIPASVEREIVKIKEDLKLVVTSLNIKEIEIIKLEEKVNELEKKLEAKDLISPVSFQCDICEFHGSSQSVLKRHKSTKHKGETLREDVTSEISLEMSPEKSERLCEFDKSISLSPFSNQDVDRPSFICDCPHCGESFTEEFCLKSHLSKIHDLFELCPCGECVDCILKELCDSEKPTCTICENTIKDLGTLKIHLKNDHDCIDKCGVCHECIDCVINGRWKPMEWIVKPNGTMVCVEIQT